MKLCNRFTICRIGVHPNHTVSAGGESRASGVPIHLLTQFVLKV